MEGRGGGRKREERGRGEMGLGDEEREDGRGGRGEWEMRKGREGEEKRIRDMAREGKERGGGRGREKGRLSIERSKVGREQTLKHRKVSCHKYHTLVSFLAPNQPLRRSLLVSRAGKEGLVTLVIIPCSLQDFV